MNELSIIFNKLNIDTKEVLDAAERSGTFEVFGLSGRIVLDPNLTYKAEQVGY